MYEWDGSCRSSACNGACFGSCLDTRHMEKPAGLKHVNSCTMAVYTPEQQTRLGVDEHGQKTTASNAAATVAAPPVLMGGRGGVGPAWTRGEIEKPAGTKDMGTW